MLVNLGNADQAKREVTSPTDTTTGPAIGGISWAQLLPPGSVRHLDWATKASKSEELNMKNWNAPYLVALGNAEESQKLTQASETTPGPGATYGPAS